MNTTKKLITITFILIIIGIIISFSKNQSTQTAHKRTPSTQTLSGAFDQSRMKPDSEWEKIFTPEQYHIIREKGTESPFTGELLHNTQKGTYYSIGCNQPVFRSEAKYDSHTGWPSFWEPITPDALVLQEDTSLPGEKRIEVLDKCGGHLGHLFDDGPPPTGQRYCLNSAALYFIPDKKIKTP